MKKLRFIIGFFVLLSFIILIQGSVKIIHKQISVESLPIVATASIIIISGLSLILFDIIREQQYNLNPINKEIGLRVYYLRKKKGISIQELANNVSLPKRSIILIEQGKRNIDDSDLINLAYVLGVSVVFLREGKQQ